MIEPNETNEELSTEDLKSVSGGFPGPISQKGSQGKDRLPIDPIDLDSVMETIDEETTVVDGKIGFRNEHIELMKKHG